MGIVADGSLLYASLWLSFTVLVLALNSKNPKVLSSLNPFTSSKIDSDTYYFFYYDESIFSFDIISLQGTS